mmetsp:Transcript_12828/g.37268  ORF Transcript_12828/g.37268 Transcript_12828/m.37268 type:complete len:346 (+) Transcript_12828:283-1320(+)|eukprot:CAMPEP_0119549572 /NCGR_PEP_ID=MMETSP1352-20130426/3239_1 /TAXON_ID=265584 /ORGANISM="Stauroneis constricta, Strain CCMP1120" /LENGTH=345 /DNA_ID=CAMNT_0007595157 /DNA_START=250 /DNA_END=1287 /DNA_ORIENTATION=-
MDTITALITLTCNLVILVIKVILAYLVLIWVAAIPAVFQERKIWQSRGVPNVTAFGMLKIYLLNVAWMSACLIGSVGVVLRCGVMQLMGKSKQEVSDTCRRLAHDVVERTVAKYMLHMFTGPIEWKGLEHLPKPPEDPSKPDIPAPVYIANHASQLDISAVYFLDVPWRWIAKSSVLFLPGVGQIMWLSNHVMIDRAPKKKKTTTATKTSEQEASSSSSTKTSDGGGIVPKTSARNLYIQSNNSIQSGVPMFFFPQGTRRMVERLPFKDGAFKIAIANEAPIYPMSIDIPTTAWNSSYPFVRDVKPIVCTLHPPVQVKKTDDIEKLKKDTFDTIYSILPDFQKEN